MFPSGGSGEVEVGKSHLGLKVHCTGLEGGQRDDMPGPRIRCGAWRQEICAARSLGKRVFRDKIKIATKARKLHYFGKFM